MSKESITVRNVKCGGCAAAIQEGLGKLPGVSRVEVDVASGLVTVEGDTLDRAGLRAELARLGYPPAD